MSTLDIITIGDAVIDYFLLPKKSAEFLDAPHKTEFICLPLGGKLVVDEAHIRMGGTASNTAVGFRKMGFHSGISSVVGKDDEGKKIASYLRKKHVDTRFLKTQTKVQTSFSMVIERGDDRTILAFHGLQDYSVLKLPKLVKSKWVYLCHLKEQFEEVFLDLIARASELGTKIAVNPGVTQLEHPTKEFLSLLRVATILVVNTEEAQMLVRLSGLPKPEELIRALRGFGAEIVVITDGEKGAWAADQSQILHINKFPGQLLDRTGAGDGFGVGFTSAIMKGHPIEMALKWGVINGAAVIEHFGAQEGLLSEREVGKRTRERACPSILRSS